MGQAAKPPEPLSKPIAFELAQRVFTATMLVKTTDASARVPTITLTAIPGTPARTLNAAAHYLALLAELGSGASELWAIGVEIDRANTACIFVETVSNSEDEVGRARTMLEDVLGAALMARPAPEGN